MFEAWRLDSRQLQLFGRFAFGMLASQRHRKQVAAGISIHLCQLEHGCALWRLNERAGLRLDATQRRHLRFTKAARAELKGQVLDRRQRLVSARRTSAQPHFGDNPTAVCWGCDEITRGAMRLPTAAESSGDCLSLEVCLWSALPGSAGCWAEGTSREGWG